MFNSNKNTILINISYGIGRKWMTNKNNRPMKHKYNKQSEYRDDFYGQKSTTTTFDTSKSNTQSCRVYGLRVSVRSLDGMPVPNDTADNKPNGAKSNLFSNMVLERGVTQYRKLSTGRMKKRMNRREAKSMCVSAWKKVLNRKPKVLMWFMRIDCRKSIDSWFFFLPSIRDCWPTLSLCMGVPSAP